MRPAYCQRETCQQIVESGGDYLVTVKGNQPQLLRDIELHSLTMTFAPFS